jgi:hypothetical protein
MVLRTFLSWTTKLTVFVVLFFILACTGPRETDHSFTVVWENDKAIGLVIPAKYWNTISPDSIPMVLSVHLANKADQPAILGDYIVENDKIRFEPLIPFTWQLEYEVRFRNVVLGSVTIADNDNNAVPELTAIYPSQDTLPANLLKIYLQFSKPMREGQSLRHIALLEDGKDTLSQVFLDLQPELWNREGTLLTLWLDPGRIKRDLQPNKKMGAPLQPGATYMLAVNNSWPDRGGKTLGTTVTKKFVVSTRDSLSPSVDRWKLTPPQAGTKAPLVVHFLENLDYVLTKEAIFITGEKGAIGGEASVKEEESVYFFTPAQPWQTGTYSLAVEARLEDLTGNNLNRPFDRDITASAASPGETVVNKKFVVR